MKFFDIKVWRAYYDTVNELGSIARQNIHEFHNTGVCDLDKTALDELLKEADAICKKSGKYMDSAGITATTPNWIYDIKDDRTWASSPNFIYSHLL